MHTHQLRCITRLINTQQLFVRSSTSHLLDSSKGICANVYLTRISTSSCKRRHKRHISTTARSQGVDVRPFRISTNLAADQLVRDLREEERQRLQRALKLLQEEMELEQPRKSNPPTMRQLTQIAVCNAIPFIGFGFLDNAIMIAAGEYIDHHIGVVFGLSTMAAAAFGNMVSDVAGIGLAGYVEVLAARLGIEEPKLESHQIMMRQTRLAGSAGRAFGIMIGCFIGMFPLLFVEHEHHDKLATETGDG